ncbi:hypothetical protein EOM81_07415 [bacterium]|nr:hypothetical protein [bacterium]
MICKVEIKGDQLLCWSPYHVRFVEACRKINGKWLADKKAWAFQPIQEGDVIDICLDFFGECNGIKKDDSVSRREMAKKEREILIKRLATIDKYLSETEIPDELRD